jgi:hypothetical protein
LELSKVIRRLVFLYFISYALSSCGGGGGGGNSNCESLDCFTSTYNLLLADVDFSATNPIATNIEVVAISSYQDMTHPRISTDKNWVAYTIYNDVNIDGCASVDSGYVNTEIRASRLDGSQTKTIIAMNSGELNTNNYWYGDSFEFTYLSGPPGVTKIYRAQTDVDMNLISGPTEVTVPVTMMPPYDPAALSNSQVVYGGLYDSGGTVASIFIQSLNPAGVPVGLTLGRDSSGTTLFIGDINENDPKISPDGSQVAFMRRAPNAGANGFGWRIFMVPVAGPLTEANISSSLGTSLLNNDVLPEWVDLSTLVFANIDSTLTLNTRTIWTMKSNGSGRKQVSLPSGYRYSDVYPFLDGSGMQKILVSTEKIGATCTP